MEFYIYPEMADAGEITLEECEQNKCSRREMAIAVYCAMQAIATTREMPGSETVH